jgi:hypothetical protein
MDLVRIIRATFEWIAGRVLWLFELLYGGAPAEFESSFGLDESVKRLSAVTRGFPIFTRQGVAMGEVSRYFVSLQKPASFRNGFAPHFDGEFCEVDGQVRLVVLLRHELPSVCLFGAWQQGHRGRRFVMPTTSRSRMVAIEVGTWRSGLSGRAPRAPAFG